MKDKNKINARVWEANLRINKEVNQRILCISQITILKVPPVAVVVLLIMENTRDQMHGARIPTRYQALCLLTISLLELEQPNLFRISIIWAVN